MRIERGIAARLLIAENDVRGHRLYYVRILADAALDRGNEVTIALRADQAHLPEVDLHLSTIKSRVNVLYLEAIDLRILTEISRELEVSLTVIPDGDGYVRGLARHGGWHGSGTVSILIMREGATRSDSGLVGKLVSLVKRGLYFYLHHLRRVNLVILRSAVWSQASYFHVAKDPVTLSVSAATAAAIKEDWGLDESRYWFAVLGSVTSRKNLSTIAEALLRVKSPPIGLLVAGRCDASVHEAEGLLQELRASGCSVVIRDRLLSDEELDTAVSLVDCLVLAHSNEGPSGLFGKAAAAGTRVVSAGAQSLLRDTRAAGAMASWSRLAPNLLAQNLEIAARAPRPLPIARLGSEPFVGPLLGIGSR